MDTRIVNNLNGNILYRRLDAFLKTFHTFIILILLILLKCPWDAVLIYPTLCLHFYFDIPSGLWSKIAKIFFFLNRSCLMPAILGRTFEILCSISLLFLSASLTHQWAKQFTLSKEQIVLRFPIIHFFQISHILFLSISFYLCS